MNNKGSDKNVVTEDVNELKRLLYSDNLTQYGKRKLVSYYDKRIQELEEELEKANRQLDLDYVEENFIPKQKVKGKLKELKIERDKIYKEFIESNRLDKQLHVQGIYLDAQIIILQELLEGEK